MNEGGYGFNEGGLVARGVFVLLMSLLAAALLKAFLTGQPFWTIIAAWTILIVVSPEFVNSIMNRTSSRWGSVLLALLFVTYLFLGPARSSVTDLSGAVWTIPGNVTVFGLVLLTLLVVNERGNGYMVRQFLMVVTFLSYMTLILVQGPIDYYLGLILGADIVPGNTEFMLYCLFSTVVGLVLTWSMSGFMRRRARSVINPGGVDWEG